MFSPFNKKKPKVAKPAPVAATTYKIRLMFEWGGGTLWCDNDASRERFDVGNIEHLLPLSSSTLQELEELSSWHHGALDWNYPPGPSPWSPEEFARFQVAASQVLEKVREELGSDYEVRYVPLGAP